MEQRAILEIDLPNSCSECPMYYDTIVCQATGTEWYKTEKGEDFDDCEERMPNCPLKPKRIYPVESEEERQTKLYNAKLVLSKHNKSVLNNVLSAGGKYEYDKELYQAIDTVLQELRFRSDNLTAMYVIDIGNPERRIHRIGSEVHDGMWISKSEDGTREIHYHNLQNGDGGTADERKGYGYVILESDNGSLTNEYGKIIDRRFVKEIKQFLKEEYGQEVDDG